MIIANYAGKVQVENASDENGGFGGRLPGVTAAQRFADRLGYSWIHFRGSGHVNILGQSSGCQRAASNSRLQGSPLVIAVECPHIPVAVFVGKNLHHLFIGLVEDSHDAAGLKFVQFWIVVSFPFTKYRYR